MNNAELGYLVKKFPRLSETFVLGEILGQESLGRSTHVFSRREPDVEPRHPQLDELMATVEYLPSSREIDPWRVLFSADGATGLDRDTFERLGEVVHVARPWGHPRFPGLIAEALHLLHRTRALGVKHIHTHFATDSALVAWILSKLNGPTFSITAHAKDIYRETVRPDVLQALCDEASFVVTVCEANVRWLEDELGVRAPGKLRRLYNGIDVGTFEYAPRNRDPREILSVGRLVEKKGFVVLLEALSLLSERGVDYHATLCGDGEQRPTLEAAIDSLGLRERVTLTGAVDQGAVRSALNRAGVFCLPCVVGADGNRDALPTVLLEALACGLPCVSTPVTGVPEILDDGAAGRIVPEHSPRATADALQELMSSEEERGKLALAGRRRAETLFDRAKNAATLGEWFDEALSRDYAACE